jgi:transcriptional regulator with XRE-family HTH domain
VYNNGKLEKGGEKMSNIGNKETFAKNLSYYLQRCGRDQKEVAEVVGVAPSTFNEWVKAKKYPRIDKIEILANYFGILKSDLIEEKGEKKSPEEPRLTEGEKMLLDLFRLVPEENKKMIVEMIRAALKTKG